MFPSPGPIEIGKLVYLTYLRQYNSAPTEILHGFQSHVWEPFQFALNGNQAFDSLRHQPFRIKLTQIAAHIHLNCIQGEAVR
jgi:hypothetical protein